MRPYNGGSHPSACMWGSVGNAIKGAEGRVGNQKTCLTGREQEKGGRREGERMWAGDKTSWPYLGCCAMLANAEAFSFMEGVSTAFAASRDALPTHRPPPHLQSDLDGCWEGKVFTTAKGRGHHVAVLLPAGTEVSNGLVCCLSLGLKMGFVICLALFTSLR